MADNDVESGRVRQRRRTRAAIVTAAANLLRDGNPSPGVNEIAEAADVSRRTVYQYFRTLDQLLLDATLGQLTQSDVDAAIDAAGAEHRNAAERVDAMIRKLGDVAAESLPIGRSLIRLTVDAAPSEQGQPKRGYRRISWIERALEPLRPDLDDDLYERLVSGLAMVVGWEALIVLQDLRALDPPDQVRASTWAARALIEASVAEQQRRSQPVEMAIDRP
jgi:AcrR family transcriptional regulator